MADQIIDEDVEMVVKDGGGRGGGADDDDFDTAMLDMPEYDEGNPVEPGTSSATGTADAAATGSEDHQLREAMKKGPSKNSILVNPRQRGNPILKFIRNVPWEYSEILPDYVMGPSTCALFLSVRYHNLHPDYIHERLTELKQANYTLRLLLIQIDVSDPFPILKTLTHISMMANLTLLPAYSAEDAGKILENYKIYENKPVDFIQEKQDPSILHQVMDALTSIRSVNKTDANTLIRVFGSLADILGASPEKIALCPGFGPQKAQRIHEALHSKFKSGTEKAK